MPDDLASSNVNRSYSLAGTSIAIFTFTLVFLYPRSLTGEINSLLFQGSLAVMGVATFSAVLAVFSYYGASVGEQVDEARRATFARRGDLLWLLGYTLLFLTPSLILFAVGLAVVGAVWLALWLTYLAAAFVYFPRVRVRPGAR
jgi:hypothetical protein